MFNLFNIFSKDTQPTKETIASFLKTSPDALNAFEKSYWKEQNAQDQTSDNFFKQNNRLLIQANKHSKPELTDQAVILAETITNELLATAGYTNAQNLAPVTKEVLKSLPKHLRPQLSTNFIQKDIAQDSYLAIIDNYKHYKEAKNPKEAFTYYMLFLQGLDILDLDPITYEILSHNQNAMSHWLPQLTDANNKHHFFKIPETKIIKVPLPILQLTRLDYSSLTPTTLKIVNDFCLKAFKLDMTKDYFIKTGTYSSKFDFRNAIVSGENEVRELGEYLLYNHFAANQMASPLASPTIPGVSTTNEWVVREAIPDKENNPCIYKGMPLHTEYRFFIDCDTKEILGASPYWRSDVMKQNFLENQNDPSKKHDYVIYSMHEETLYKRYHDNIESVTKHIQTLLNDLDLKGQWSLDVMQNNDDFWLIDMALANQSALKDVVPKEKLANQTIDWLPKGFLDVNE